MFPMTHNIWARLLAYVTGLVNQKLLLQNEYLAAENRILRAHLPALLRLSDPLRSTLAKIGKRLGRSALPQVACVAKPDTILAWYRRLVAGKFDASKFRPSPGRPLIAPEVEALIVRFARENSGWGQECLSKLILFGEASLRRALTEYIEHHHFERNHQGKGNLLLFPSMDVPPKCGTVHRCQFS
jgi:hypothetical protein